MSSKEKDKDWWDLLPPPKAVVVKPKPIGKKNDDWNNIPSYVESMIFSKCSEGNWIDCRICKKYSPIHAAIYRINSLTPFAYGKFSRHLACRQHLDNVALHEVSVREIKRKRGVEAPPKPKQQSKIYTFAQPRSKKNKPCSQRAPIMEKTLSSFLPQTIPRNKCRGIRSFIDKF